ncbi:DUF1871 family protein [Bacillus kwashiorkori]|uniref:DUF1871 family protein n=1 Tax=Bacillus kwashiorkori TaxID=1522318 RepID=UPI000783D506|nr:DUF1871 family protein [Bacillus kwashiorkori]
MKLIASKVIQKHINSWDPEYLLAGGAPEDEYEREIEEIVDAVLDSRDEIEIAEAIKNIFDYSFGRDFHFDECLSVAKKIWNELYE